MADSISFFIDGKPYTTYKAAQPVTDILALAGLSVVQFTLIAPDGVKYADAKQYVEINSGSYFTTEKRDRDLKPEPPKTSTEIHYKVNGEQQATTDATLTVEQILRAAGKAASIDLRQLNSYILENIETGLKFECLSDAVEISNDDEFLAVHSGATPVASIPPL